MASAHFRTLRRAATLLVAVATAWPMSAAASPARDSAVIVDSGSTNTAGYTIEVWSDGAARITPQSRPAGAPTEAKTFAVPSNVTARFFADLKAAHAGNVVGAPCMKSASFGTTTHVSWHGWKSPDLDCPSDNPLLGALVHDVDGIRAASGAGSAPAVRGGPLHAEPSPTAHP